MAPLLAQQPLKAAATIFLVAAAPPYLVVMSLFYAAKQCRPVSAWSLKTAIGNEWLRLYYQYATKIQLQPSYADAAKLKERYVLVQPGPPEIYTGVLQSITIKPKPGPAVWFPEAPATADLKSMKVVIHFQGGAFVTATDPVQTGQIPAKIFKDKLGASTFYAQYRLSRSEDSRFPGAVQDAVTFYRYVLDQGVDPRNIIISGDSAGGTVALALVRYIEESGVLPSPCGVMLWSPWVDVTSSALSRYSKSKKLRTDFLTLGLLRWGMDAFEPVSRSEETERYLCPAQHAFHTQTPVFVNAGTAEIFHEEVSLFVKNMEAVEGNRVLYVETKDAPHDIIIAGGFTGFVPEAEAAVEKAQQFFNQGN